MGTGGMDLLLTICTALMQSLGNAPPPKTPLLDGKDILLTFLGAIAGAAFGLFAAVLVQPLIDDSAKRWLVSVLGTKRISSSSTLAGTWHYTWGLDQGLQTPGTIVLSQIGKNLAGEFVYQHFLGPRTYRLLAVRGTEDWISGRYEDVVGGRKFHGVFQLHVEVGEEQMSGRWMAFNREGILFEGPWVFTRQPSQLVAKGDGDLTVLRL
jgi:hypothetical protein